MRHMHLKGETNTSKVYPENDMNISNRDFLPIWVSSHELSVVCSSCRCRSFFLWIEMHIQINEPHVYWMD